MSAQPSLETNSSVFPTRSPEIFDNSMSSDSSPSTEPSEQKSLEDKLQGVGEKNIIIHCDQRFSGLPPHTLLVAGKSNPDDLDMPDKYNKIIRSDNPPLVELEKCVNKQAFNDAQFLLEVSQEWGLRRHSSEFGH